MNPFDIYNVERVWKNCPDQRPYVIIDVRGDDVFGCFPISTPCYDGNCFFVDMHHADFAATGLSKSCNVQYCSIIEVRRAEFRRFRGSFRNQLLQELIDEAGL